MANRISIKLKSWNNSTTRCHYEVTSDSIQIVDELFSTIHCLSRSLFAKKEKKSHWSQIISIAIFVVQTVCNKFKGPLLPTATVCLVAGASAGLAKTLTIPQGILKVFLLREEDAIGFSRCHSLPYHHKQTTTTSASLERFSAYNKLWLSWLLPKVGDFC